VVTLRALLAVGFSLDGEAIGCWNSFIRIRKGLVKRPEDWR